MASESDELVIRYDQPDGKLGWLNPESGTQLSDLEPGIRMIETAYTNDLKLVLKDGQMVILPNVKGIDREKAGLVAQILQRNSDAIMGIVGDQEKTRAILAETQKTLAGVYGWWNEALDLWDRLERSYRKVFTDDHACIAGEECIEDAVVSCTACAERRTKEWEQENSTTEISQKSTG